MGAYNSLVAPIGPMRYNLVQKLGYLIRIGSNDLVTHTVCALSGYLADYG